MKIMALDSSNCLKSFSISIWIMFLPSFVSFVSFVLVFVVVVVVVVVL